MQHALIECVPNFSEGRNPEIIRQIANEIEKTPGIKLLDVDGGMATNRTVITFVGSPEMVVEAAFLAIKKASELIDMRTHHGEHPRMGATDVCPLIPISGVSMEETIVYAKQLAAKVSEALDIPVYLYEKAATTSHRINLANIRYGEYEGLEEKMKDPAWAPDFGGARFNARSGAIAIGVRDFLVAYNVNLNTTSVKRANSVAFDVRERGRVREVNGRIAKDENGRPIYTPGMLKHVKAIGWYIEEYGLAQVSMNLTNIRETPVHLAFEACCRSAARRGMRVIGSELIGLIPLKSLVDAGKYFLRKQKRSCGINEEGLIKIAIASLGLDELAPFDPKKKVIEYVMQEKDRSGLLKNDLQTFADETASESPTPRGGSVSAYLGALAAALGTKVANLSAGKKAWETRWEYFSNLADNGQQLKDHLLQMVDEDSWAFNRIVEAHHLPKGSPGEQAFRDQAIQEATLHAMEVPLQTMKAAFVCFDLIEAMVRDGLTDSITDAGIAALCARGAIYGAFLNVKINALEMKDKVQSERMVTEAQQILAQSLKKEKQLLEEVMAKIGK